MSFTITTDVFCDGCRDWVHGCVGHSPDRSAAWKAAKSKGWTKKIGKHLCPMCNGRAKMKLTRGDYVWKDGRIGKQ